MVKLNLLYLVFMLPVILISFLLCFIYDSPTEIFNNIMKALSQGKVVALPILPFLPWIFSGPITAGLTYVLRNYSNQKHAFIVSDFVEHTTKNFKQGMIVGIIGTAVVYMFLTALAFYIKMLPLPVVLSVGALFALVLLHTSYYVFPIMVTFDLKLTDIIKNSMIFSVAKSPLNLFITVVIFAVHIALLWYIPILWAVLMVLILPVWSGFTMNYFTWGVIEKYMITEEEKEKML